MAQSVAEDKFRGWNKALVGAYKKGEKAFADGLPLSSCPYDDLRKDSGKLTWSRSFRNAWRDGWQDAQRAATSP